ncbi:hypothetical protein FOXB_16323, partial [Fusarium oxysporum f. sp. conglutinans Fo5176]
TKGF